MIEIMLLMLMGLELLILVILLICLRKKNSKIKNVKLVYDESAEKKFKVVPKSKFNLPSVKEIKPEQWFVFGLYALVGFFVFYVLASNYLPDVMKPINSGDYELNLNNPIGKFSALYFDKDIFGEVEVINEKAYISVNSENIVNLVFSPKKIIPEGIEATIKITGINKGTEVYFDEKLIIPDLTNYEKIKEFKGHEVWVSNDFDYENLVEKSSVEDYIYFNFPSASVYSFKELDDGVPILTDWEKTTTKIDTTFRDNLKLAVYHGGGYFNFEFTKQDLNSYTGKDEYTLKIIEFGTDKVMFEKVYKDDGDKKDSKEKGEEQDFKINLNLERGIYYLEFKKDKNNKASDSTLKDLKIGSNKVLIVGKMLVYEPNQKFFTKANSEKEIKFNYWWTNNDQKVYFTGDLRKTFNIDGNYKSKDYVVELEKGSYYFEMEKGFIWVKDDYASIDEYSWFNMPSKGENKLTTNDILIIDRDYLEIEGDKISVQIKTEIKDETSKYKFQVLEKNKFLIKELTMEI